MPVAEDTTPRRSALTRERIVELALEIIDEDGLEAMNMRRLAADAGVKPMSLYHHYPNKRAILDAVGEKIAAAALGVVAAGPALAEPRPPALHGPARADRSAPARAPADLGGRGAHAQRPPLDGGADGHAARGRASTRTAPPTVYHVLGSYTLGLGYARMLGDEVQTTRHRRPAHRPLGRLPQHDAGRHAARRLGPAGRVRDRAWTCCSRTSPSRPGGALTARDGEARRRPERPVPAEAAPRQDDQPGQDGRRQPLLALDQVLALPAARPRHPGRLPGPGRRDRPAGRARRDAAPRRRARPRRHRGVHHLGRPRLPLRRPLPRQGRLRLPRRAPPDEPARGGRPARRQRVLRAGRGHLAGVPARTSAPAILSRCTARPSGRSPACRRRAATSSSASATSCRTRWWSAAAARTSATSATRRRSSAAAGPSTCRRSRMHWPRSTASPAATSTSSTTTSSAARRSPRRCSTASRGWAACGRRPGRSRACSAPASSRRRWRAGCAACSSASRR